MKSLDRRLEQLENQQNETVSFGMLTISDKPVTRKEIENDTRKYIAVNSPFGMALKPVDEEHPRGMTKKEHLKAGNNISFVIEDDQQ
ncbi:hypothetical protein ACG2F4_14425 [Halalkalibaculum sp. DA3122]|uniref:hypothetical protein n=1 Tax=Halalkalibaculum sp. DA3122 TaxID=3373607 RepID=UPI0037547057